ncbi:uncharacterized protein LOC121504230 [Cheilinus undulatus]|uniref:uncharacterized protein LOC121504230 n=1 Tax=Cheilinus undulatus TaxID=241271 RepID=UPI001BD63400|nr:uncharacterized protein LOC121504230 [Cheilinus undulatus]XP_041634851.1 uncharacterized protein LOC121504230 [Cheilinus undulatus]
MSHQMCSPNTSRNQSSPQESGLSNKHTEWYQQVASSCLVPESISSSPGGSSACPVRSKGMPPLLLPQTSRCRPTQSKECSVDKDFNNSMNIIRDRKKHRHRHLHVWSRGRSLDFSSSSKGPSAGDPKVNSPPTFSNYASARHVRLNTHPYTFEAAMNILRDFGLEKKDLEFLISYPEDQLTPDTLPSILEHIQRGKRTKSAARPVLNSEPQTASRVTEVNTHSSGGIALHHKKPWEVLKLDRATVCGYSGKHTEELRVIVGKEGDSRTSGGKRPMLKDCYDRRRQNQEPKRKNISHTIQSTSPLPKKDSAFRVLKSDTTSSTMKESETGGKSTLTGCNDATATKNSSKIQEQDPTDATRQQPLNQPILERKQDFDVLSTPDMMCDFKVDSQRISQHTSSGKECTNMKDSSSHKTDSLHHERDKLVQERRGDETVPSSKRDEDRRVPCVMKNPWKCYKRQASPEFSSLPQKKSRSEQKPVSTSAVPSLPQSQYCLDVMASSPYPTMLSQPASLSSSSSSSGKIHLASEPLKEVSRELKGRASSPTNTQSSTYMEEKANCCHPPTSSTSKEVDTLHVCFPNAPSTDGKQGGGNPPENANSAPEVCRSWRQENQKSSRAGNGHFKANKSQSSSSKNTSSPAQKSPIKDPPKRLQLYNHKGQRIWDALLLDPNVWSDIAYARPGWIPNSRPFFKPGNYYYQLKAESTVDCTANPSNQTLWSRVACEVTRYNHSEGPWCEIQSGNGTRICFLAATVNRNYSKALA